MAWRSKLSQCMMDFRTSVSSNAARIAGDSCRTAPQIPWETSAFAQSVRFMAKKSKGRKKADKPAGMNIGLEGETWSTKLREIVKEHGPLTVSSYWEHAKDIGLRSKRHMKIILKWMRGQNHVKLICNHIGDKRSPTDKEFMYTYVVPRSERQAMAVGGEASVDQGLKDIAALAGGTPDHLDRIRNN